LSNRRHRNNRIRPKNATREATPHVRPVLHCSLSRFLASVGDFAYSFLIRAVGATVKDTFRLYSVPNYLTAAVRALRRHRLNCALKAIKNMRLARCSNFECLVIVIATGFTTCHRYFLLPNLNEIPSLEMIMHQMCHKPVLELLRSDDFPAAITNQ
jgi:hypothetical protein